MTITATEAAARRVPDSRRYSRRQRMTVDWVKHHHPDVWASIWAYVEETDAA